MTSGGEGGRGLPKFRPREGRLRGFRTVKVWEAVEIPFSFADVLYEYPPAVQEESSDNTATSFLWL